MTANTAPSKCVATLKWLLVPRAACMSISAISMNRPAASTQSSPRLICGQMLADAMQKAKLQAAIMVESANFAGLSHAGAPVIMRWSTTKPARQNPRSAAMMNPNTVNAGEAATPAATNLINNLVQGEE
jgi:hypothetical protein